MKIEEVKLHNKEFEDMELTELYAERACRRWHRCKVHNARNGIHKKLWWLNENKPILSVEEIKQKYERGEMTEGQYRASFANRKSAINYRMRCDDYIAYADRIIFNEDSIVAYIDELIAEKEAKKDKPNKNKKKGKQYDPRKRVSRYNQLPLDPRRKWSTKQEDIPFPRLQKARARWKDSQAKDAPTMNVMKKMQPVVYWDIDTLRQIAQDRGYFNDLSMSAVISEALNITVSGAKSMLESGRLTWSQCIIIGAVFEMTPKEFCDTFLHGYFHEVTDGVFKARVDDVESLLDAPYRAKPLIRGEGETDHE